MVERPFLEKRDGQHQNNKKKLVKIDCFGSGIRADSKKALQELLNPDEKKPLPGLTHNLRVEGIAVYISLSDPVQKVGYEAPNSAKRAHGKKVTWA